jgi:Cdc6-like AAA superfamily ATPase
MRLVTSKASIVTRNEIPVPYEIFTDEESNNLLIGTDEAEAYGIYTTNNFSESMFPPNFVQAFTTRLAAEIAMSLEGDRGKHLDLLEIAVQLAEGSKEQNANENIQVVGDRDSKYTRSRL